MIDASLLDTIASTLPAGVSPDDEQRVTEHATFVCGLMNERLSEIEPHIPDIIERAKALQLARAH
jgi:hypothetical protein